MSNVLTTMEGFLRVVEGFGKLKPYLIEIETLCFISINLNWTLIFLYQNMLLMYFINQIKYTRILQRHLICAPLEILCYTKDTSPTIRPYSAVCCTYKHMLQQPWAIGHWPCTCCSPNVPWKTYALLRLLGYIQLYIALPCV